VHETAVTASQSMPASQLSMRTNDQLLQLLRALPSGSIVPFVLVVVTFAKCWSISKVLSLAYSAANGQ